MSEKVVIDVEMCQVPEANRTDRFPFRHEIIQIGAVSMDESCGIRKEFSSFVRPLYGELDPFIQELTGIGEADIQSAPLLEEVLREMLAWIGDPSACFYSWSIADYVLISREIRAKGMDEEEMSLFLPRKNWKDYQAAFGKSVNMRWKRFSLGNAMKMMQIEPEGIAHNALSDARNTARLIAQMKRNRQST